MTTMKITIEDMGITKTYEKDFGENGIIAVDDFFETCLAAYSSNEYCNDIDVNIYGLGGSVVQTISWDKDNYITNTEQMDVLDDLMSFLEQSYEVRHHRPVESWYMGHKY